MSWTRKAAWEICEAVAAEGFTIKSYQEAESTHSIYLTIMAESGHVFGVRVSNHPKPGFSRMVSKGGNLYCGAAASASKVAARIIENPSSGIIPKHNIWAIRPAYTVHN